MGVDYKVITIYAHVIVDFIVYPGGIHIQTLSS